MELGGCWVIGALLAVCVAGTCSAAAVSSECPPEHVTLTGRDKFQCCSKCPPGTSMKYECTESSNSDCAPCPVGSYSENWNTRFSCFRCVECIDVGMKYKKDCTNISDAQCECSEGYVCNDGDCKSCVPKREVVQSILCSPGTYSDTGALPCRLWTNCTALGHIEITPANQTSDAICNDITKEPCSQRGSTDKVKVVLVVMVIGSFLLLCLSIGMHIVLWRRQRRNEFKLLTAETSPRLLRAQTEDTCSTHFPEQECGGISHQEKKNIEQAHVAVNCGC